ncbi:TetR/AcrR family transcriptional regulator [Endozoicomonas acroporae]|uniref:TetR/AcrR family transcriptional regulator n=1 Tax=Endozoicomonas acroporae TaxID=1701104 RepID=UPI000C75FF7D|nr:TetR/AcrR family transcriptional regulator [Endozoicomonas acroporae]
MDLQQVTNRRSPAQSRSRARVTVILQAVKSLIEEKGIGNLKMTDIAKRANTSSGSIYQYFSDKDTLILSLAEHFIDQIHAILDSNLAELKSFSDITRVFEKNFDDIYRLHKNEPALREIWFDSINPELSKLAIRDCEINTDKIYHKLLELGEPEDRDQLKRYILLLTTQFAAAMRLCFASDAGTPEQFRDIFIDIMVSSAPGYFKSW